MELTIVKAPAWAVRRVLEKPASLVAFSFAFRVVNFLWLAPAVAWVLRVFLGRWGKASVGNFEVASFLLSPTGLLALVVVGGLEVATVYLELAGLMRLMADPAASWWSGPVGLAAEFPRLVRLGARQLAAFLALAAPFLAGVGLVYWWFWSGRDLNGLIVMKPPAFWAGAAGATVLGAAYLVLAGRLFLRWILALSILLFEPNVPVSGALESSTARTEGRLGSLAVAVGAWGVSALAVGAVVALTLKVGAEWLLGSLGPSLTVALAVTAAVLIVDSAVATALAALGAISFAALLLALYVQVGDGARFLDERTPLASVGPRHVRRLAWAAVLLVAAAPVTLWVGARTLEGLRLDDRTELTAHRGGASLAPENTVAAIRQAGEAGADWAEIDVQLTADGALVVLHDTDLARSGGGPLQVGKATLEQVRALDVGSLFGPGFAGEKIPTFDEVLAAAEEAGVRLTVELKPHGKADAAPLAEAVVAAVRRAGMTGRCRVCSQSYEGLMVSRKMEPSIPVGFIAANALGDLARLDVDFLMVSTSMATRGLVGRAGARGVAVHAWTVNDPAWLSRLIDRGVQNVITDDPVALRARLREIGRLSPVERLLLRAGDGLAD
jgi:glycerophosphoryl diester phosphodiesterase